MLEFVSGIKFHPCLIFGGKVTGALSVAPREPPGILKNPTHPHDVRVLLELLSARSEVDDVAADSGLGVFPDGRLSSPAGSQRKTELVRLDGGVPPDSATICMFEKLS